MKGKVCISISLLNIEKKDNARKPSQRRVFLLVVNKFNLKVLINFFNTSYCIEFLEIKLKIIRFTQRLMLQFFFLSPSFQIEKLLHFNFVDICSID